MREFKVILVAAFLVAALVLLVLLLYSPQPISIVLETGQEVSTKSTDYFPLTSVLLLTLCAFVIGAAIMYLFYNADMAKPATRQGPTRPAHPASAHAAAGSIESASIEAIMHLLKEDERKAVRMLRDHDGEMLQNALAISLNISKVKATRLVSSLERKQVITKRRHGLSNMVTLKKMQETSIR